MDAADIILYEIPSEVFWACLDDEFLEEKSSLGDLETDIVRGFPHTTKRQHAIGPIRPTTMSYVPFTFSKSLMVKSNVRGSTGKVYDPIIMFAPVQFEPENTEDNVTFTASDGKEYNVKPLSYNTTNVTVRCNCLDFYWRFANWNANDRSLFGRKPKPYHKKTNRPPVNPDKVPGMCKHLLKMAHALMDAGILQH